jgi:hypothetical protein
MLLLISNIAVDRQVSMHLQLRIMRSLPVVTLQSKKETPTQFSIYRYPQKSVINVLSIAKRKASTSHENNSLHNVL